MISEIFLLLSVVLIAYAFTVMHLLGGPTPRRDMVLGWLIGCWFVTLAVLVVDRMFEAAT